MGQDQSLFSNQTCPVDPMATSRDMIPCQSERHECPQRHEPQLPGSTDYFKLVLVLGISITVAVFQLSVSRCLSLAARTPDDSYSNSVVVVEKLKVKYSQFL